MKTHTADQPTVTDDPRAREALRRAFENTARWPQDFKGFTADLMVNINGKEFPGSNAVSSARALCGFIWANSFGRTR